MTAPLHSDERTTPRQAVVLIHGIGEQKPMATLRGFVESLGFGEYYNKPDRFSDGFELRRLTVPWTRSHRTVDFLEFYWAHHLQEGNLRQTMLWAAKLAARQPFWRHGPQLRLAMAVVQVAAVVLVGFAVYSAVAAILHDSVSDAFGAWRSAFATITFLVGLLAGGFIRNALADAPRYLTPAPANVEGRNAIRAEGLELLRKLHSSGDYQRIVVVGHSLGSVIALDLIRLLWDEMRHPDPLHPAPVVEADTIDVAASTLRMAPKDEAADAASTWQQAQYRLWRECRARGMPWLITDLVTLGSPLAHGSFLLDPGSWWGPAKGPTLLGRQHEREVPTCPPDETQGATFYLGRYQDPAYGRRDAKVAHHAAPFAVTRWSNLYFPVRGLHGDPVGGPLAEEFGPGIVDIAVRTHPTKARTMTGLFMRAHTRYWRPDEAAGRDKELERQVGGTTGTRAVAGQLRTVLMLDIDKARREYPPADPIADGWRP